MSTANSPQHQTPVGSSIALIVLFVPGASFAALVLLDGVMDRTMILPRPFDYFIGLAVMGGVLSLLTTPIGVITAVLSWRRLVGIPGVIAKTLLIPAILGAAIFILKYANPFFTTA